LSAAAAGRRLRILHVGSGFRPMRFGGLVAYVEDLMQEQARRGHEVSYFFSGRYYPWLRKPRLHRWRIGAVSMLEVVASPLYDHGRQPELELSEPRIERLFQRALDRVQPDVVHVQEIAGLPSSLLEIPARAGIPALMTLQDYFPLCSTFKLLDSNGQVCLRREIGEDCVATVAADPRDPAIMFEGTLRHEIDKRLERLSPERRERLLAALSRRLGSGARRRARVPDATAFQRRRELNLERLNGLDRVVAMSNRVAEIYALLGVEPDRLTTRHLTLAHIERLRPRSFEGGRPVTFATLGGGESAAKGSRVLLDAVRALQPEAREGRFRLLIFGHVEPRARAEARELAGVELRGAFAPAQLDALLDQVDVGIMPSIWEEAYGYAGVEFLAKGIPVIANAIGGMVDYVRERETGWLNQSRSAEGLAELMRGAIERPGEIERMNTFLRDNRDSLVKTMEQHADEMEELYGEVIAAQGR
jgi:glycosyltransferase involved in cell wall biosynthesis